MCRRVLIIKQVAYHASAMPMVSVVGLLRNVVTNAQSRSVYASHSATIDSYPMAVNGPWAVDPVLESSVEIMNSAVHPVIASMPVVSAMVAEPAGMAVMKSIVPKTRSVRT